MVEKINDALKGIYDNLTDEQKEKVKACKTMEEMMELAGEWGVELPDEAVDAVAGGADTYHTVGSHLICDKSRC